MNKYLKTFESFNIDPLGDRCKVIRDIISNGFEFSKTNYPEDTKEFRFGKDLENNPYSRNPAKYSEENYDEYLKLMNEVSDIDRNSALIILRYAVLYGRPNIVKHILSIYSFSEQDIEGAIKSLNIDKPENLSTITPENREEVIEILEEQL